VPVLISLICSPVLPNCLYCILVFYHFSQLSESLMDDIASSRHILSVEQ